MKALRAKKNKPRRGFHVISQGFSPTKRDCGTLETKGFSPTKRDYGTVETQGFRPTGIIQKKKGDTKMTFWRLHYHIIWATFQRERFLAGDREKMFYGVLYKKGRELGLTVHAAGNVEDHVHIVVSIPPKLAAAECIRQIKGASAFAINHMPGGNGKFQWQAGYGAVSIGERSLPVVMAYAKNQKEHHRMGRCVPIFEKSDDEDGASGEK
jgi:putative transposase